MSDFVCVHVIQGEEIPHTLLLFSQWCMAISNAKEHTGMLQFQGYPPVQSAAY